MTPLQTTRRRILALFGVGLAGALAGCEGGEETPVRASTTQTPEPTPPPGAGTLVDSGRVEGDEFGNAIAVDGNRVLVGAPAAGPTEAGLVTVFEWSGADWDTIATLAPDDGEEDDRFGSALAVEGETVLVGAYGRSDDTGDAAGSTYVFERGDGDWVQQVELTPSDGDSYDRFGWSLAIDGERALIGAYNDEDPDGDSAGAAYVFERSAGTWRQQAKLTPDDGRSQAYFGRSVDLEDGTALIGARRATTVFGGEKAGAAYVFEHTGEGWTQQTKLTARDSDSWDRFGEAVALDGERALIGAYGDEDPNGEGRFDGGGSAYVFARTEADWRQQAKLAAGDGGPNDAFGVAVALSGETALVGAPGHDTDDREDVGAAYVYESDGEEWPERTRYGADAPVEGGQFGAAVSMGADIAAVGAPAVESVTPENPGSAYVFDR